MLAVVELGSGSGSPHAVRLFFPSLLSDISKEAVLPASASHFVIRLNFFSVPQILLFKSRSRVRSEFSYFICSQKVNSGATYCD